MNRSDSLGQSYAWSKRLGNRADVGGCKSYTGRSCVPVGKRIAEREKPPYKRKHDMANMNYCAFENTYHDLRQCLDILQDGGPASENELKYAKLLMKLCRDIVNDHAADIDRRCKQKKKRTKPA